MANGGLITDYIQFGSGAPGTPSLGNNSTESGLYLRTSNNHLLAWDGSAWQDVSSSGGSSVLVSRATSTPTDNVTVNSGTFASFSTVWNVTVTVASGQKVTLFVTAAVVDSAAGYTALSIYRSSTQLGYVPIMMNTQNTGIPVVATLQVEDTSPGTGSVTYEVKGITSGGTLHLYNNTSTGTPGVHGTSLLIADVHS